MVLDAEGRLTNMGRGGARPGPSKECFFGIFSGEATRELDEDGIGRDAAVSLRGDGTTELDGSSSCADSIGVGDSSLLAPKFVESSRM